MDIFGKSFHDRLVTSRDKINKNPAKIGQAVCDILSKSQPSQTAEETYSEMTPKYFEMLMKAVDAGCQEKDYPSIFWVIVKRQKNTLAGNVQNVLSQKYITSAQKPRASLLREECPNADFDVYRINKMTSEITLFYTMLSKQDSKTVMKNPHLYDPDLVRWTKECQEGLHD